MESTHQESDRPKCSFCLRDTFFPDDPRHEDELFFTVEICHESNYKQYDNMLIHQACWNDFMRMLSPASVQDDRLQPEVILNAIVELRQKKKNENGA